MRNAINNNPKVQLGVIAALVLVAAVVLVPSMMGKGLEQQRSHDQHRQRPGDRSDWLGRA